jgi:hypothetical protein
MLAAANQDHDAQIQVSGREVDLGLTQPSYYVEVTSATSPTEYLEREALTRNGFVYGGGQIRREGSKGSGDDRVVSEAVAFDGTAPVANAARWIAERIAEKGKKVYPEPCILLVGVYPEQRLSVVEWAEVAAQVDRAVIADRFALRFVADWATNTVFRV